MDFSEFSQLFCILDIFSVQFFELGFFCFQLHFCLLEFVYEFFFCFIGIIKTYILFRYFAIKVADRFFGILQLYCQVLYFLTKLILLFKIPSFPIFILQLMFLLRILEIIEHLA